MLIRLRKNYGKISDVTRRFLIHLGIIIVTTPVVNAIVGGIIIWFYVYFDQDVSCHTKPLEGMFATSFISFSVLTLYEAIYFFYKYKEAIVEQEQLRQEHIQTQLDNLRNQINPHFLFNSLNTLMNLIPTDPDRAMNYLNKLSRFYRYSVGNREMDQVPLHTELENVRLYSDLLKERFGENIHIELPELTQSTHIHLPPLSLQMLLENAVKHNIVSKNKPLHIQVELSEQKDYLWIRNNLQKKIQAVESTGMGLKNIHKRFSFFTDAPVKVEETSTHFQVGVPLLFL